MSAEGGDDMSALDCVGAVLAVIGSLVVLGLAVIMATTMWGAGERAHVARQVRIKNSGCVHTGYAGRGYEKVYNCNGRVLRESEI